MSDVQRDTSTLRRARAAAALTDRTLGDIARECGISTQHLRGILGNERRASERVWAALKSVFGPHWAFVRGQTDALKVQP